MVESNPCEKRFVPDNDFYHLLIQNLPGTAILVFDRDERVAAAEGPLLETCGFSPVAVIGKALRAIPDPELQNLALSACSKVFEGNVVEFDRRFNTLYLHVRLVPVRDAHGAVVAGMVVIQDITAQKQPEQALMERETRYRQLMETCLDPIILSDAKGNPRMVNPAACRVFGRTEAEWLSSARTDILDAADPLLLQALIDRAATGTVHAELTAIHGNGSRFPVEVVSSIFTDPEGNAWAWTIFHDITERKQREMALAEREIRFRRLMETSLDGLVLSDPNGHFLMANPAACEMFGRTEAELLATPLSGLLDINDPQFKQIVEERTAHGTAHRELMGFRRDGSRFPLEVSSIAFTDLHGNALAWTVVRDITERKEREMALAASEARYRLLADHSIDLIVQQNPAFEFTYISPSSERILGYQPDELIGKSTVDVVHPDDVPRILQSRVEFPDGPRPLTPNIFRFQHKDGHYVWLERAGQPVFSEDTHELLGFVGSVRDVSARMQAEQALRESETRYRLLAENSMDVISLQNMNFEFVYVSPSCERVFGFTPDEVIGKSSLDFIHPDDKSQILYLREARDQSILPTLRFRHKDGHYLWVERTGQLINSPDGSAPPVLLASVRDVTARIQAEQALRESEARYRLLAENSSDLITQQNTRHEFVYISPSCMRILGYMPEEMLGKTDLDFVHPDDKPQIDGDRKKLEPESETTSLHVGRFRHKAGHYVWLEWNAQKLYSEDSHEFIGFVAAIRDVTARVEAENARRESEAQLRALMENNTDGILLGDEQGHILAVNDALCKMSGHAAQHFLSGHAPWFFDQDDPRVVHFLKAKPFHTRGRYELTALHPDGTPFSIEVSVMPIPPYNGQQWHWSIIRDLTEQIRHRATLVEQERLRTALEKEAELNHLKSHMMDRVAHEFRTPLAIIQATTETLNAYADRLSAERRTAKIGNIRHSIQRLTDMLDEITVAVTDTLIPKELRFVPLDLMALCRTAAVDLAAQAELPGKFKLEGPEMVSVVGDAQVLKDMLAHVMHNAIQYSPADDVAHVYLALDAYGAEVRIIDHGTGILPTDQARIFEPFFRGSNAQDVSGLGLGLTIALEAVEAHHGTIRVESVFGQGTTVTIWLPSAPVEG